MQAFSSGAADGAGRTGSEALAGALEESGMRVARMSATASYTDENEKPAWGRFPRQACRVGQTAALHHPCLRCPPDEWQHGQE